MLKAVLDEMNNNKSSAKSAFRSSKRGHSHPFRYFFFVMQLFFELLSSYLFQKIW